MRTASRMSSLISGGVLAVLISVGPAAAQDVTIKGADADAYGWSKNSMRRALGAVRRFDPGRTWYFVEAPAIIERSEGHPEPHRASRCPHRPEA